MSNVSAVTDKTFPAEVLKFKGVAIVDFWATWCGPCTMLAPIIDELAKDFKDNKSVKFVKADVDDSTEIAGDFGIRAIPCLVLFKDGIEVDRQIGGKTKAELKAWIEKALEKKEEKEEKK